MVSCVNCGIAFQNKKTVSCSRVCAQKFILKMEEFNGPLLK